MPVGSRLVGCVRPRVSGMHYTFRLPEQKKKKNHLTSRAPCGPSHTAWWASCYKRIKGWHAIQRAGQVASEQL